MGHGAWGLSYTVAQPAQDDSCPPLCGRALAWGSSIFPGISSWSDTSALVHGLAISSVCDWSLQ